MTKGFVVINPIPELFLSGVFPLRNQEDGRVFMAAPVSGLGQFLDDPPRKTRVVGVTFEGRQRVVASLVPGQKLRLRREPYNRHDPNAIRVECLDGQQIGYIDRDLARDLASVLDKAGGTIPAEVVEITGGSAGYRYGVEISYRLPRSSDEKATSAGNTEERTEQKRMENWHGPFGQSSFVTERTQGRIRNRECIAQHNIGRIRVITSWEAGSSILIRVALSSDGTLLAVDHGPSGVLALLSMSNGQLIRPLAGLSCSVDSIAFDPSGHLLATGGGGYEPLRGEVALWRVSDGALVIKLGPYKWPVKCVTFSPNGHILATGSDDGIVLWEVSKGRLLRKLGEPRFGVEAIAFSPDGQLLASSSSSGGVQLWRLSDGALVRTLTGILSAHKLVLLVRSFLDQLGEMQ